VIGELHALGLRTVLLTGDNQRTAGAIGAELGIDDVLGGLRVVLNGLRLPGQ
jgi:cation transport ATPase